MWASGGWIFGVGKEGNGVGWVLEEGNVRFIRVFQHKGQ